MTVWKKVHKRKDKRHEGSKGHGDRRREGRAEREDKLRRSYTSNPPNGKPHNSNSIFFKNQQFPVKGKLQQKAATVTLRDENEKGSG